MAERFGAVIGNDKLKNMLAADFENRSHSHAYIIEGAHGSGKMTLAMEMCKALLCKRGGDSFPCGTCSSCRKIQNGFCTDIYILTRGDAASISIDAVRKMTDTVSYPPDDGDYKVYIIKDADKMTVQAQNAFLLSLEEPPEYVMYILLCTDADALLETIRSRAPVIKTELFSVTFVSQWLRSTAAGAGASDDDIFAACAVSGGALGVALDCISGKEKTRADLAREAGEAINVLCTKNPADRILHFSALKHTREEYGVFFDFALLALRDLIASKSGSDETVFYQNSDEALNIAARIKLRHLMDMFEKVEQARLDITQSNASSSAVLYSLAAGI